MRSLASDERLLATASGIVVAPERIATSCQVLARARHVQIRRGNAVYDAKLEFPDVERDLCQLHVPGLVAPTLARGSARGLRPGQRLYVVGFGRPNELSIADGLVSAMRDAGTENERIQTTVPAARGLLGAGVFDGDGTLVGLVTSSPSEASTNAFGVPVDWLKDVPARGQLALERRSKVAAAGGGRLPAPGSSWVYSFVDRMYSRQHTEMTVKVLRVNGNDVEEAIALASPGVGSTQRVVNASEPRLFEQVLSGSTSFVELAPYLLASYGGKSPPDVSGAAGYPVGGPGLPGWIVTIRAHDWEQVSVLAGNFRALRLEVIGRRTMPISGAATVPGRFRIDAWYATDVKRYVKLEHRVWSANRIDERLIGHDVVELLRYSPPS